MVAGHLELLAAFFVQADPRAPVLDVDVPDFHLEDGADPANVYRTAVLPLRTTCFEPRTGAAGFAATIWQTTNQSNRIRMAARCGLTDGFASRLPICSIHAATCTGSTSTISVRLFRWHQSETSRPPGSMPGAYSRGTCASVAAAIDRRRVRAVLTSSGRA